MPAENTKNMLIEASSEGYAVPAFNVTNVLQMQAIIQAAERKKSPIIIQTSVTPTKTIGPEVLASAYYAMAKAVSIPVALHLDHCDEVNFCKRCIDAGYTNIMIDASAQPFEENVKQTKEVSDYAKSNGNASVEGELGTVSGVEDQVIVAEDEVKLCNPNQALEFTERSNVDSFAPAIGTAHGIYKDNNPKIDIPRLEKINEIINGSIIKTPLVVHGGTGLQPELIKKLIKAGGAKFNISTQLKHVWLDSLYKYLSENPNQYEPSKVDNSIKQSVIVLAESWIDLLGSSDKALQPIKSFC